MLWVKRENSYLFSWFTLVQYHAVYQNLTCQSHFLLHLLRIIGQMQINYQVFWWNHISIFTAGKRGEGQHLFAIMGTFKGQDNSILQDFCSNNRCEIEIVPHKLTNKFQSLYLTVNKVVKAFFQNRYNDWFSDQVAWQLKSGNDPTDIKASSKFHQSIIRKETSTRQLDSRFV